MHGAEFYASKRHKGEHFDCNSHDFKKENSPGASGSKLAAHMAATGERSAWLAAGGAPDDAAAGGEGTGDGP